MPPKKSLLILSLIILISGITAGAKSAYKDGKNNNPTAANSELIPDQRPRSISESTSTYIRSTEVHGTQQDGQEPNIITFSEFPVGTYITNQYSNRGIIFGGDGPFITTDLANPTSPVLSGSPQFMGAIEGRFVSPRDGISPITVSAFSLDAGYFDAVGSTRIEWFDLQNNKLGEKLNSVTSIEHFVIEGGNIARWRIATAGSEPAGFAIDNVSIDVSFVQLTKIDDVNDGIKPGGEISYTICYNYLGDMNYTDINNVNIIDYLPDEVQYVWSRPEPSEILDCNTIIWEIGTLKPGDINCISLKVKVRCLRPEPGSKITSCSEIRSGDVVLNLAYEHTPICANYLIVDDFESYNNTTNRIHGTWIKGGGGTVGYPDVNYAELTIVHGGGQSMPFDYNNTKTPCDSNATSTFTARQDWTVQGVKALSLWLRGYPAPVGSFTKSPAVTYTMTASGTDINIPDWRHPSQYRDEFHCAYMPITGTCDIVVRVDSMTVTDPQAKAGLMMRDSLADNSAYAMLCYAPGNSGVWFQYRPEAGKVVSPNSKTTASTLSLPRWLWLRREFNGSNYEWTGYYSANGTNWTAIVGYGDIAYDNYSMADPVYIGLIVTARNAAATCTSVFSNVSITQGISYSTWPARGTSVTLPSPWTSHQDIGIKSNIAAPLYVTLRDSDNVAATVTHPDPNTVLATTWQEWLIPLANFSDVNLAAIKKITVGVADSNGTGTLFFDDVRLYPCVSAIGPLGDFTCDCMVDFRDLAVLANEWFNTGCPTTDLYKDYKVDIKDLAVLAENWLIE